MRIGFFADMYLPHISGVTNHLRLYKRYLESLGHEVFLFTFGDLEYEDAEPNVVRSPAMPWGNTGWQLGFALSREAKELAATLDIAHVHHPFESGRLVAPIAAKHGIPLVFTTHARYDLYSDAYAAFVPHYARYAYIRRSLAEFCAHCSLVIAPSGSIAEWLADFAGVHPVCVLPNGIDTSAFEHPAAPVERASLGFSAGDVVFCHAGRLGPEKNLALLAEAFASAAASAPQARLLVVGDGPARAEASGILERAGVGDRARWAGAVAYERVPDFEAAADAFVTASVSEVHPLVVIEAMAAGLPVAAIASPGISDTVTDGDSGLLAPSADAAELAARIARIANDAALRSCLAHGARNAAARYSLPRTAGALLGEYERLVSERRSR